MIWEIGVAAVGRVYVCVKIYHRNVDIDSIQILGGESGNTCVRAGFSMRIVFFGFLRSCGP